MRVKRQHLVKGQIDYEHLSPNTIEIAVPVHLLACSENIVIDSTGVRDLFGHVKITSEMVKHLKEAYLEAFADAPTATDAVVDVELYNVTDDALVTKVTYSGDSGYKVSSDIASSLKELVGKVLCGRFNVTTASGTSGASQRFRSVILRLVFGIS